MKHALISAYFLLLLSHCDRSGIQAPSELARVPSVEGTLYASPDAHELITGGILTYRIYETGDIFYSGDVSYFGAPGTIGEIQVPFHGRTKVAAADVLSATYKVKDEVRTIRKISTRVDDVEKQKKLSHVFVQVVDSNGVGSSDANGMLDLKTDEDLIKIKSATIVGTLYEGTKSEIRVRLELTENKKF